PGSRQSAFDGSDRTAQPMRNLVMTKALDMAKDKRQPISLGQSSNLFVDHHTQVDLGRISLRSSRSLGSAPFDKLSPRVLATRISGHPKRDSVKPVCQQTPIAESARL